MARRKHTDRSQQAKYDPVWQFIILTLIAAIIAVLWLVGTNAEYLFDWITEPAPTVTP